MLQALRMTICSATVLLFEARICYPALRVTLTTFYLAMDDLLQICFKFRQQFEKIHFSKIFTFAEILRSVF